MVSSLGLTEGTIMYTWLRNLTRSLQPNKRKDPVHKRRLQLEALEDRYLLAGNLLAHAVPFSATEGLTFAGPVATFSDSVPGQVNDYSVIIHWGDQTSSFGTVIADGGGNFTVRGSHTYVDNGNFAVE